MGEDGRLREGGRRRLVLHPRGKTLGLVGESGSGKSTTGYCILQLLKPTGLHPLPGKELTELKKEELRRMRQDMQIVFQDPYRARSAHDGRGIVAEPLEVHGIGRARAAPRPCADCSRWSGSTRTTRTATRTSSPGPAPADRRRPRPRAQPEADHLRRARLRARRLHPGADPQFLKDLQRDFGLTYLFISHDLAVVRTMSDEIAVMNQGKLVEVGPAEQVYTSPKDEYTRPRGRAGSRSAPPARAQGRAGSPGSSTTGM